MTMRTSTADPMKSIRAVLQTPLPIDPTRRLYRRHRDPPRMNTMRQARDIEMFLTLLMLRIAERGHLCGCAACKDIDAYLSGPALL
jgi:hypothetical protein